MGEMLDKGPLSSPTTITSTTRANRSRRITRQLTSIRASRRFLSPDGLRHEAMRTVRAVSFPDWRRSQRPQSISTNSASEIEPPQTSKVDASKNETVHCPDGRLSPLHHGGASGRHESPAFCGCWRLVTGATQQNSFPVVTDKSLRQSEAILSSPVLRKLRPGSWSIHNASRQGNK